jgi:hypothetical protein
VGPHNVVVGEVRAKQATQVAFVAHDEEIEAANGADDAFGKGIGQSNRLHTVQTIRAEAFGSPIRSIP